ncbi:methyltransferase domain-containing protein [Herminiimonas sp. CN]|uniref:methyltransferase domain-containing protein n=1 Tax=Herminiimonas sp. CN TaxID=1349818 RepID=UPI0009DFC4F3|nr:methyltransferase domain-containing protein [Herminiimonas sp. CN]
MTTTPSSSEPRLSAPIDLERVRHLFSSVKRVADADFLRREVSARMFERLELVKITPRRLLDAGCGAGGDLALLQKQFAQAQVLGADASAAMLLEARSRLSAALSSVNRLLAKYLPGKGGSGAGLDASLLCADFARLPLAQSAVDLVWSNLALHWHPQPDRVFSEWRRVLRQDGLLMFSCFGPDTCKELRTAFAAVDAAPHVLPFVDMHDLGDMLVEAGFSTPVMDMEHITVTYANVEKLMADVRALGGNPLSTRRRGLLGKGDWSSIVGHLESQRQADGKIPLTFEIIYGHAFRPAPSALSSGESIIRISPNPNRK